jgi:hypothetical protein
VKKIVLMIVLFAVFAVAAPAFAQQVDLAFGISTLTAPSASTSNGLTFPSERGGAYPVFSGDFLLHRRIGIEGEVAWRASQNLYGGFQPYRPVFYAFNGIWAPHLAKPITAELMAGIGGESLRFYTGNVSCSFVFGTCTNYVSSNHFMGDVGAGIRAYFWHGAFLRPEVRLYLVHNNAEFSSGTAARYGVSLGYSFGGR